MSTDAVDNNYGTVTEINEVNGESRELKVMAFVTSDLKDGRHISVVQVEDGTMIVCVENPQSTGRALISQMRLSPESFTGLFTAMVIYMNATKDNFVDALKKASATEEIQYALSPNLKPIENIP